MPRQSELSKSRKRTRVIMTKSIRENYFGETVRELRLQRQYTQGEAADLLGITQSQWCSYENGAIRPHLDIVITIARKFEIDPCVFAVKCIDKSMVTDPVFELTFNEYKDVGAIIEKYKRNKLKKRVEAKMLELSSYIGA